MREQNHLKKLCKRGIDERNCGVKKYRIVCLPTDE